MNFGILYLGVPFEPDGSQDFEHGLPFRILSWFAACGMKRTCGDQVMSSIMSTKNKRSSQVFPISQLAVQHSLFVEPWFHKGDRTNLILKNKNKRSS